MIIGVDARELEGKPTGVGVYLGNILQRISLPSGSRLQLYFKGEIPDVLPDLDAERILLKSSGSNVSWQQITLAREITKRNVTLLFSPANSCPWRFKGLQAVTIHDISFFRSPRWFTWKERISRQLNSRISFRAANRIYVVSPYVREELLARFKLLPGKILVTPNGVFLKKKDHERSLMLKKAYQLENAKIILYAGSIFNRRHLPILIEAVAGVNAVLVVIGKNRTFPLQDLDALAHRLQIAERVRLLDYVPEKVLHDYYQMADLFVYLSEYEGFGIPPLEAMSYGLPVILSRTPAMDEIYASAAHFVDSISVSAVRRSIEKCLSDEQERERLRIAGKKLAEHYNWEESVEVISKDWEQLLAGKR